MEILSKPKLSDKQINELRKVGEEFAFTGLEPERFNATNSEEISYFMEGYNTALETMKNTQEVTSNKSIKSL